MKTSSPESKVVIYEGAGKLGWSKWILSGMLAVLLFLLAIVRNCGSDDGL